MTTTVPLDGIYLSDQLLDGIKMTYTQASLMLKDRSNWPVLYRRYWEHREALGNGTKELGDFHQVVDTLLIWCKDAMGKKAPRVFITKQEYEQHKIDKKDLDQAFIWFLLAGLWVEGHGWAEEDADKATKRGRVKDSVAMWLGDLAEVILETITRKPELVQTDETRDDGRAGELFGKIVVADRVKCFLKKMKDNDINRKTVYFSSRAARLYIDTATRIGPGFNSPIPARRGVTRSPDRDGHPFVKGLLDHFNQAIWRVMSTRHESDWDADVYYLHQQWKPKWEEWRKLIDDGKTEEARRKRIEVDAEWSPLILECNTEHARSYLSKEVEEIVAGKLQSLDLSIAQGIITAQKAYQELMMDVPMGDVPWDRQYLSAGSAEVALYAWMMMEEQDLYACYNGNAPKTK